MSVNIGDTIQDGGVVWTVGRKITNAPNIIADCDSVMEGSIKQFDSTTSNIPAVGAEGNLVTVGLASSKAQIAVTSDNTVYYRSYASSAWGTWQRLTTASEIVDSMSMSTNGYVKFGPLLGGLTIQWGRIYIDGTGTINFPVSFSNEYTYGMSILNWNNTVDPTQYAILSYTASGANVTANLAGGRALTFIAIGY